MMKLAMSLVDSQLERLVGHRVSLKLQPVFRPDQPPISLQALIQRSGREWRELAEDRKAGWPGANLLQNAIGDSWGVVIQTDDERSDCIDISFGESIEHRDVFFRLIEALVDIRKIDRVNRLHADEDYLPARSSDQVNQFFIAKEIGADLR